MSTNKEYSYFIDDASGSTGAIMLGLLEKNGNDWIKVTTDNMLLEVLCGFQPADLDIGILFDDIIPGLREEHMHIILDKAFALGYTTPSSFNPDTSMFFESKYNNGVKKAKKKNRINVATGFIKPQDF